MRRGNEKKRRHNNTESPTGSQGRGDRSQYDFLAKLKNQYGKESTLFFSLI
jgi:hypothetical protein